MDEDRELWSQQSGESSKAFHAFTHYRDLEPAMRSLEAAYEQHRSTCLPQGRGGTKRVPSQWKLWSAKFDWVERVAAYDGYRDSLLREVGERDLLEAQQRWLTAARICQELAFDALSRKDLNNEAVRELRLLFVEGVRIEREALEFRSAPQGDAANLGIQLFLEATRPSPEEVAALFADMSMVEGPPPADHDDGSR